MDINLAVDKAYIFLKTIITNLGMSLVVAVIILLIGLIAGKLIGKLVKKLLHEIEVDAIIKKTTRIDVNLERMLSVSVAYFIYFITIIMVFNQLNITTTVLQMLSAAVIVLVVISILLAIKDFMPNLFAGFYIAKNRFISIGEVIRIKGLEGKIVQIILLETKLETIDGDIVYVPNSAITKTEIIKVKKAKQKRKKE